MLYKLYSKYFIKEFNINVLYWNVNTAIKTSIRTIKKIGKDLACILSPTIISGEVSNCKDIPITIIENIVRNNGTV